MGWGDEIIASGQARLLQLVDPRKVAVYGHNGEQRWHPAWENNPRIAKPGETNTQILRNGPSLRPYIKAKEDTRWIWREWECPRGELYLSDHEKALAELHSGFIIVEPNLKLRASPNKNWGWDNWIKFMQIAPEGIAQLGPPGTKSLPGAYRIQTDDFREAVAVLSKARAYVGHEGGMHHAAAALGIPAVVIFGGFISPLQTGYKEHRNLYAGGKPCGMRVKCPHCEKAMRDISPEDVLENLLMVLGENVEVS
jgi:hypothetical protein